MCVIFVRVVQAVFIMFSGEHPPFLYHILPFLRHSSSRICTQWPNNAFVFFLCVLLKCYCFCLMSKEKHFSYGDATGTHTQYVPDTFFFARTITRIPNEKRTHADNRPLLIYGTHKLIKHTHTKRREKRSDRCNMSDCRSSFLRTKTFHCSLRSNDGVIVLLPSSPNLLKIKWFPWLKPLCLFFTPVV